MLSLRTQKWLKTFHIFLGCIWGGGAASLFAIHCLFAPDPGPELYARNMALIYVDNYILVPSAVGSFLTGIIYCQLTRWGYAKHYWIIAKLAANVGFLVAGFFLFIPALQRMAASSLAMRNYMEVDPSYDTIMLVHMIMAGVQIVLVLFMIIISVFKPWGRTGLNW